MQITYINNDGAGFADRIEIEAGTTIQQLFTQRLPHGSPADYLIRVNRQPTTSDYVLQPGDRVSMTPTKIEGAAEGGERGERKGKSLFPMTSLTSFPSSLSPAHKERLWEPVRGSTVCTSRES
jgi:hypothetical protein